MSANFAQTVPLLGARQNRATYICLTKTLRLDTDLRCLSGGLVRYYQGPRGPPPGPIDEEPGFQPSNTLFPLGVKAALEHGDIPGYNIYYPKLHALPHSSIELTLRRWSPSYFPAASPNVWKSVVATTLKCRTRLGVTWCQHSRQVVRSKIDDRPVV